MKTKIILLVMMGCAQYVTAQQSKEKITKELSFEKPGNNTLMIFNISGNVTVTGTTGDKVVIEVEKVITGKTDRRLQLGKEQVQLGVIDRADSIIVFVEGLCSQFGNRLSRRKWNGDDNRKTNGWGYYSEDRHNCDEEFDHQMNFTIKVPGGINLYVSTINNGDVSVENVSGTVRASNINGSISLKNISGATNASTINGSVDLEYSRNPPQECRYYSLNGDINAWFRKGLTANLSFESFNGDLYTNVEQVETLPATVSKKESGKGLVYKLGNNQFRIGKGGVLLDFETFNGDVYLREKVN